MAESTEFFDEESKTTLPSDSSVISQYDGVASLIRNTPGFILDRPEVIGTCNSREWRAKRLEVLIEISSSFSSEKIEELKQYLSLSVKGQWNYDSGFYLFLYPSVNKITLEKYYRYCYGCHDLKSSWDVGFGGGLGYKFLDSISIESSFEKSNDYNYVALGLRYNL